MVFFSENRGKSQSKMDDKCPNGDVPGPCVGFSEVFQMRFLGLKKQKWGFNQQNWWYNGIYGGDNGEMIMWILKMTYLIGGRW